MKYYINITDGDEVIRTMRLSPPQATRDDTNFFVTLTDLNLLLPQSGRRRRRRAPGQGPLQRLLDPNVDHPILKSLFQTFGPMIQSFITTQLPLLLAADEDSLDDPPIV